MPPSVKDRIRCYVAIGSNLGDRAGHIRRAIEEIGVQLGPVVAVSKIYETEAWGNSDVETYPYLNAAISLDVQLSPKQTLHTLLAIEQTEGRLRVAANGPRTLDLDLLFYGSEICAMPSLTLPHPRLHLRRFVLRPLMDIAPDLVHPLLHKDIATLLRDLNDPLDVRPHER